MAVTGLELACPPRSLWHVLFPFALQLLAASPSFQLQAAALLAPWSSHNRSPAFALGFSPAP